MNTAKCTPLMQQYFALKKQHEDAFLLFQVGDFYELFFEDAQKAALFLGITLTKRGTMDGNPIPLCGVPVHTLDHYLTKLIRGGFKVALCDQLEAAQPGKMVDRGVTRVFTPGTLVETALLNEKSASYLFTFLPLEHEWGLLFGELLTAQLFATTIPINSERALESELARFFPDEIVLPHNKLGKQFQTYFKRLGYATTFVGQDDTLPAYDQSAYASYAPHVAQYVSKHESLGLALRTFYAYLNKTQSTTVPHFSSLHVYKPEDFLVLDSATQHNLELVKNSTDGSAKYTLFSVIDRAVTAMGSRMIRKWLLRPLLEKEAIEQRQDVVEHCVNDVFFTQQLAEQLREVGDIERIIGRIAFGRSPISDYRTLVHALGRIPHIKQLIAGKTSVLLKLAHSALLNFTDLQALLEAALNDDNEQEYIIKKGFDAQLDKMRILVNQSNERILALEKHEQEKTGIGSLKVRYNAVHGYYIEVTKTHLNAVPGHYKRQQTLVGRERFITPELQELQHEIFKARNEIDQREKELFESVKATVYQHVSALRKTAYALAQLDALLGLAHCALDNGYIKPLFSEGRDIHIQAGRHPVIEQQVTAGFIANDTQLDDDHSLWIITGPNMGGKSTYLRQVALICIMGQIGSFVPARSAQLALLDRVFTRIGSGDNLAGGKSTFLVEMEETAAICTYATERSLVILDEVGRGTSTFDGLALAQAIVEYIHAQVKARCLFATHYHELALLKDTYPGIVSYYAASKKTAHGIVFLYVMVAGIADGSFGIEVAKLAQVPLEIIARAETILQQLEQKQDTSYVPAENDTIQIIPQETYDQHNAALQSMYDQLKAIDYENLSPKQAFDILWKLNACFGDL